jgi:DNA-binding NtrC family response regulator
VLEPRTMRVAPRYGENLCVVMTCSNGDEAAQVAGQLLQVNSGVLITYRRCEDVLANSPRGQVVLLILASTEEPAELTRALKWMRNRWPNCPITVVGDAGGGDVEVAARQGGACFLARPVTRDQWQAIVTHVLEVPGRVPITDR